MPMGRNREKPMLTAFDGGGRVTTLVVAAEPGPAPCEERRSSPARCQPSGPSLLRKVSCQKIIKLLKWSSQPLSEYQLS